MGPKYVNQDFFFFFLHPFPQISKYNLLTSIQFLSLRNMDFGESLA